MIPVVLTLALLTLAALFIALRPLRSPFTRTPEDDRRADLEEEYQAHLAELRDLQDGISRGDVDPADAARETARLQNRAARVLAALETLPPEPVAPQTSPLPPALLGVLGVGALMVLGAFTFLPRWQLAGLGASEAQTLESALSVPKLARAAGRSGKSGDYLALGRAAFAAGQYPQAAGAYAEALRQNPRQPEALRRLGAVLLQDGSKSREGAQLISAAAALDPNSDEGQFFLGVALYRAGDKAGALQALTRYQQLNPSGRDADELLATLRSETGDLGASTYNANCATCHGPQGRGGAGPNLRADALGAEAIGSVIRHGAAGMPAFPQLGEREVDALATLLQSWQKER